MLFFEFFNIFSLKLLKTLVCIFLRLPKKSTVLAFHGIHQFENINRSATLIANLLALAQGKESIGEVTHI